MLIYLDVLRMVPAKQLDFNDILGRAVRLLSMRDHSTRSCKETIGLAHLYIISMITTVVFYIILIILPLLPIS